LKYQEHKKTSVFSPGTDSRSMDEVCIEFVEQNQGKMMLNFQRVLPHIRKLSDVNESVINR
jgi:hypothetical protein